MNQNGWTKYEYAVLSKLEDVDSFVQEVRGFMIEVREVLAQHADHPARIEGLETVTQTQDQRINLTMWKVGILGVVIGTGTGIILRFLLASVF